MQGRCNALLEMCLDSVIKGCASLQNYAQILGTLKILGLFGSIKAFRAVIEFLPARDLVRAVLGCFKVFGAFWELLEILLRFKAFRVFLEL